MIVSGDMWGAAVGCIERRNDSTTLLNIKEERWDGFEGMFLEQQYVGKSPCETWRQTPGKCRR
jgi:hypothetical protein